MNDSKPQIFFASKGTKIADPNSWKPIHLGIDDITIDHGQLMHAGPTPMNPATLQRETIFTLPPTKKERRKLLRLVTGLHRLPGDKPLIHNGKKPR